MTLGQCHSEIAETDKVGDLSETMAFERVRRSKGPEVGPVMVLDVYGHTRAYAGTKKVGKPRSIRLRFPAPAATEETWGSDVNGAPVMVAMAESGTHRSGPGDSVTVTRVPPDDRAGPPRQGRDQLDVPEPLTVETEHRISGHGHVPRSRTRITPNIRNIYLTLGTTARQHRDSNFVSNANDELVHDQSST
jgi:hypothetical protein